jgi:hypothetical protein
MLQYLTLAISLIAESEPYSVRFLLFQQNSDTNELILICEVNFGGILDVSFCQHQRFGQS